ncbi:MAG TPA: tripartite tricarboxylate transporter substrate-binding protein [Anaeromyxobacteraceae bacterium]|nr:tripartite tricarboxylate transporter substrate-binding protein [Anaeromyxobacteraceae bacterium]
MAAIVAFICFVLGAAPLAAGAWEPTKPVEFVVPAGTGGGADVMARFIAPIIEKYKLSPRPFMVVNKSGGAGAEGFLYVKGKAGDPHVIIITLDNLFTTPIATGVPFNWKDLTPVARMALDHFVLWVNAESPYKSAAEYLDAAKKEPGKFLMGGTGSNQEDQIITVMLEQMYGVKFSYVPFKGGGEVAVELVGKHVNSTVNNPAEAVSHWKAGRLRPLAAIDSARIDLPDWKGIPTMKESTGKDVSYLMLRGMFSTPGINKEQQEFYVNVLKKVAETPEWKKYVADNGLKAAFLTGPDYVKWLEQKETTTRELMKAGKLIKE